jgi:16S rRNA (adenine1518-N6/adenine1519-N6)-dimethyltransferase
MAGLSPDDVALEIGAGVGTLTARLAARCAHVHAIEIDRRLEPALALTLEGIDNVRLEFADAMRVDLAALRPAPLALVANLPYNIATPLIMETLPICPRACVMVQREIAARLFAQPGVKAYGAVSVLVQLCSRRIATRPVSRNVFTPVPNVDSTLVAFERLGDLVLSPDWPRLSQLVHGAFAHRRKRLDNSLDLVGLPAPPASLAGLRAEQLAPQQFLELL